MHHIVSFKRSLPLDFCFCSSVSQLVQLLPEGFVPLGGIKMWQLALVLHLGTVEEEWGVGFRSLLLRLLDLVASAAPAVL